MNFLNKLVYYYFKIPEILRFLLATFINASALYTAFLLLYITLMIKNYYILSLILLFIITTVVSYITMKFIVFRTSAHWVSEYLKSVICFSLIFVSNILFTYLLVDVISLHNDVAQIAVLVITTIITYISLKYFAFNDRILSF